MYAKGTLKYYLFVSCLPLGRGRFARHSTVLDINIMGFLTESHDNIHLSGNSILTKVNLSFFELFG